MVSRTCEVRIIDLSIPQTCIVEDLKLGLVCFRNVGEVFLVIGVNVLGVSLASLVSQVVPCQRISKISDNQETMT